MKLFWIILVIYLVVSLFTTDSTDNGLKKSGLGLYIDNATGCHYIQGGMFGNMVPRLDENGKQICTGWAYEYFNKSVKKPKAGR